MRSNRQCQCAPTHILTQPQRGIEGNFGKKCRKPKIYRLLRVIRAVHADDLDTYVERAGRTAPFARPIHVRWMKRRGFRNAEPQISRMDTDKSPLRPAHWCDCLRFFGPESDVEQIFFYSCLSVKSVVPPMGLAPKTPSQNYRVLGGISSSGRSRTR